MMKDHANASIVDLSSMLTSYCQLFGREVAGRTIHAIEIPLIQRDYAQGRSGDVVGRIRTRFVNVLCNALKHGATPIDLDFVYGDVTIDGDFYPLDGQQRLTTLFLLHWYVARRAGIDLVDAAWTKFTYATRPGVRHFCECLVDASPEWDACPGETGLSGWLKDQIWYLLTWQHDPSVQSMLVMLDAVHGQFKQLKAEDCSTAWQRLSDPEYPAIRFHVLPMVANQLADTLYIKMNSRGKPLTDFETFKAHFEAVLKVAHPGKAGLFSQKVDRAWTDVLWEYKGEDFLIDEEFMRYFRFVTEVCAWDCGIPFGPDTAIDDLAKQVYGGANAAPVDFLLGAFDVWHNPHGAQSDFVRITFEASFTLDASVPVSTSLLLYGGAPGAGDSVDFFRACCKHYGTGEWTYGNTLLLYAVLWHRIEGHADHPSELLKRLRVVRNLIEGSSDELAMRERDRESRMKNLLADVRKIIRHGDLSQLEGFNKAQIADEIRKGDFLLQDPALGVALYQLEDHDLLRGCLAAFTLDPATFAARAQAFEVLFSDKSQWLDITGALLAKGEYAREWPRGMGSYSSFGSEKNTVPWQELFRGRHNENTHPASQALMALLEDFFAHDCEFSSLATIRSRYLMSGYTERDWRYYFVNYPIMRGAARGVYVFGDSRYRACMLKGARVSFFQDPYLVALVEAAGFSNHSAHFCAPWPWFYGIQDETGSRRLKLANTGITIECVDNGWQLGNPPIDPQQRYIFNQVCERHLIKDGLLFSVLQNGSGTDMADRVELGAKLLKDLVKSTQHAPTPIGMPLVEGESS